MLLTSLLGTYKETTMPVIEHYSKEGKVATVRSTSSSSHTILTVCQIDASASIDEVHEKAKEVIAKIFAGDVGHNITA